MEVKVKFMRDYGEYKAGQVADLPEDEADDLYQGGIAHSYTEPPKKAEPKVEPKKAAKK